jgi:hypothetical protein
MKFGATPGLTAKRRSLSGTVRLTMTVRVKMSRWREP